MASLVVLRQPVTNLVIAFFFFFNFSDTSVLGENLIAIKYPPKPNKNNNNNQNILNQTSKLI